MLTSDYKDMLSALSDASAEFLVVGVFVMAAHRCPRATGDIDVWIRPTAENAARVWQALVAFGAPLVGLHQAELTEPEVVFQIGVTPCRIALLTRI